MAAHLDVVAAPVITAVDDADAANTTRGVSPRVIFWGRLGGQENFVNGFNCAQLAVWEV
jgi:hypothetical protein